MYTVDYFIKKFEAIPEEKWCSGLYEFGGSHCALGHCGTSEERPFLNGEAAELWDLFNNSIKCKVHMVNDGNSFEYQQPTPKQRILAALYDIKKLQQPVYNDITSQLASEINVGDTADQPVKQLSWDK